MPDLPRLIIISGPPGAGKSTLARPLAQRLGLPLIAKDALKEEIADAVGDSAHTISAQLGLAAIRTQLLIARELLSSGQGLVLESFFHKGVSEPDLAPLIGMADATLIHVTADPALLISRYERRIEQAERHPVHVDANANRLRHYLAEGVADPLELDIPIIEVDTTYGKLDIDEIAFMLTSDDDD